jgi:transcriptional regulator with XRE-family HTH domain
VEPQRLLKGLGEAIRERRGARSQEALALETGIHRNYIGGIERGERKPSVGSIVKLADALDADVSELFARAEELSRHGAE